jgi:hypothetical protein
MKTDTVLEASASRAKLLKLNVFQTWITVIGALIGIGTVTLGVAKGWVGLPAKVDAIQQHQQAYEDAQRPLMVLTNRVDSLEENQRLLWAKISSDHDLLLQINQKLTDVNEQQKEISQDVRSLKK